MPFNNLTATKKEYRSMNIPDCAQFERLIVMHHEIQYTVKGNRQHMYLCKCDCGNTLFVRGSCLISGNTKSCGCLHKDVAAKQGMANTTHGDSKSGEYKRLYRIWYHMICRCRDKNSKEWENYGGRGITVCEEWLRYIPFKGWAIDHGYTNGLSIDRIDNDLGYFPENCQFATSTMQNRNKRSNRMLTAFGETKCLGEWAQDIRCVVSYQQLYQRILKCHYSPEDAITTPLRRYKK